MVTKWANITISKEKSEGLPKINLKKEISYLQQEGYNVNIFRK